jgi:hypothetical protein
MAMSKKKMDGESTPPKKSLSSRITGREKFKTGGTVDGGRTYKMKEVTKSNGGTKTVGIKKEKGLFGAKEKNIYKTTPISQGGVDRIKVKSKSITKEPGLFGKRTVKKSSYVRDVPAPSNVSGKGIPGPSMKKAPMPNNRLDMRGSDSMRNSMENSKNKYQAENNKLEREKRNRTMATGLGAGIAPFKKKTN